MELLDTSLKVTFSKSLVLDSLLARIPLRSVPTVSPRDINGKVLAKAWCEAVVQRTPEPVRPDQVTGLNPRVPEDGEVNFGRRFQIVSFRWLHADEV